MSLPAFAGKQLSKHRAWVGTALAGVVIVVLVLAALAERRDLNPVGAHLEGKTVVLENADGRAVYRFPSLGDSLGSGRADFGRLYRDIALADIDGDGFNEACFGVRFARGGHLLRCVRIPSGKRLWEDLVLRFDIDYPRDPSVSGNLFFVRCIDVWDYDGDGRAELLLALSHDQQHPAIVIRMDPMSRAVLNRYDHSGAFVAMERTDLNGDGRQEVLLGGTNNSYNVPVVAVLDPISMAGTGPAAGDWSHGHPRPGHELAYIRFEPSTLSRAGYVRMRSVVAGAAAIDIGPDKIVVRTFEGQVQQIDGGPFLQAVVLRYFDHRLRPIRGTTDDLYRHTVASLVERGLVPHRSYASELDSLRDAVRYWTGTEWTDSVFTRLTYPEDDA